MLTNAASDTQETLPSDIMEVPSPPSASKPMISPDHPAEKMRESFQRRQPKTATKKMGDNDKEFPCSPGRPTIRTRLRPLIRKPEARTRSSPRFR